MDDKTKETIKDAVADGVKDAIAAQKDAKNLSWWERALWALLIVAGSVASALFTSSCESVQNVTPEQVQQAAAVGGALHEGYHALTGRPCVFIVEDCGGK